MITHNANFVNRVTVDFKVFSNIFLFWIHIIYISTHEKPSLTARLEKANAKESAASGIIGVKKVDKLVAILIDEPHLVCKRGILFAIVVIYTLI